MIYLLHTKPSFLDTASNIAEIIIAIVNLVLAFYVFYYQRNKDKIDKRESNELALQALRLQWFKELIIQPHLNTIYEFYKALSNKSQTLKDRGIIIEQKSQILSDLKDEFYTFRQSFLDLLLAVDIALHKELQKNIDELLDNLSKVIFDEGINLNHKPAFEEHIIKIITYSKNEFIGRIFSFKG